MSGEVREEAVTAGGRMWEVSEPEGQGADELLGQ